MADDQREPFCFSNFQDVLCDPSHPQHPSTPFAFPEEDAPNFTEEEAKRMLAAVTRLFCFIWGEARFTPSQATQRLAVVTWMLAPQIFGNSSQVELAQILGVRHKQSIGRHVSEFRQAFGYFNRLMRSDEAIMNFKLRERRKREG